MRITAHIHVKSDDQMDTRHIYNTELMEPDYYEVHIGDVILYMSLERIQQLRSVLSAAVVQEKLVLNAQ